MFLGDVLGCFLDALGVFDGSFGDLFWMLGGVFWMFWGCLLDVFWRHFTNQATPCKPSVPGGGCKFADAGTNN